MTILLTGAGGFLGLNLVDAIAARGLGCVALNDRPLPAGFDLPAGIVTETADVRDRRAMAGVLARHGVSCVIHAAAVTLAPGSSLTGVETAFDVNTVSTAILLEEARKAGVARFVYPSSTAVYGHALYDGAPVDETAAPRPASVYGYTKLASERLVTETAASFGLSCVRARITALFGPHERETATRDLMSLPFQLVRAAMTDTPVRLPRGHRRDWTYSRDVAEALVLLATAPEVPRDLYNLGIGRTWPPEILADALGTLCPGWRHDAGAEDGSDSGLIFPDHPGDLRQPLLSARFTTDFGFDFRPPETACRDHVDWLRTGAQILGADRR
ncbi:NAD-dependent epimerase/dehydratase family protein [Salipiger sp.]|uniref:NAD-dependent epimerase/dehydratase family protein n=1 Tax=Salipiger sp. TaxID=2078585 RepID=UPI003A9830B6